MVIGLQVTNGLKVGFEWSLEYSFIIVHLGPISVIFMWNISEEDFEDDG